VIGTQAPSASAAYKYNPRESGPARLLRELVLRPDFEETSLRPAAMLIAELDLAAHERRRLLDFEPLDSEPLVRDTP
jgi:hypothetical protein